MSATTWLHRPRTPSVSAPCDESLEIRCSLAFVLSVFRPRRAKIARQRHRHSRAALHPIAEARGGRQSYGACMTKFASGKPLSEDGASGAKFGESPAGILRQDECGRNRLEAPRLLKSRNIGSQPRSRRNGRQGLPNAATTQESLSLQAGGITCWAPHRKGLQARRRPLHENRTSHAPGTPNPPQKAKEGAPLNASPRPKSHTSRPSSATKGARAPGGNAATRPASSAAASPRAPASSKANANNGYARERHYRRRHTTRRCSDATNADPPQAWCTPNTTTENAPANVVDMTNGQWLQ